MYASGQTSPTCCSEHTPSLAPPGPVPFPPFLPSLAPPDSFFTGTVSQASHQPKRKKEKKERRTFPYSLTHDAACSAPSSDLWSAGGLIPRLDALRLSMFPSPPLVLSPIPPTPPVSPPLDIPPLESPSAARACLCLSLSLSLSLSLRLRLSSCLRIHPDTHPPSPCSQPQPQPQPQPQLQPQPQPAHLVPGLSVVHL